MSDPVFLQAIGWAAAAASTSSFAPQAWKIIRTRDASGLSAPMYALTTAAFALWLTYGGLRQDWALIVPNLLCLALALFILIMIVIPARKRHEVADVVENALPGVTPREEAKATPP